MRNEVPAPQPPRWLPMRTWSIYRKAFDDALKDRRPESVLDIDTCDLDSLARAVGFHAGELKRASVVKDDHDAH